METVSRILFYDPKKEYGWASNFYPLKNGLVIDGEVWRNTEAYFQAMKFRGPNATPISIEYSDLIREADSPMKTKMLGRQKKDLRWGKKWKLNKRTDDRLVNDLVDEYKDLGVRMRNDWGTANIATMVKALAHKFHQYPELYDALKNIPNNTLLVEHTKRDKMWGDGGDGGTGVVGKNYLGRSLTALSYVFRYGNCDRMNPELRVLLRGVGLT